VTRSRSHEVEKKNGNGHAGPAVSRQEIVETAAKLAALERGGTPHSPLGLLMSALVLVRCVSVIAFGAATLASFTILGSRVYSIDGLHQAAAVVLAVAAGGAAFASWMRYRAGRSSQSILLFVAFAGMATLYAPLAAVNTAGPNPAHLLFAPLSRLVLALGLLTAVLGLRMPSVTRLPPWVVLTLAVFIAFVVDAVIYSELGTGLYHGVPEFLLGRAEAVGLLVNLVAVAFVVNVWWKTRRPFMIYLIGAICALTLGGSLFLSSDPWEGRWWAAHLGVFVSAIAVTEGIVAETSRRGRLSEVMDLGGLSRLAEGTVDAMRDGLALHDAVGTLVGWNPAAERITGWPREMAALRMSPTLAEGMVELPDGKWVDVRHFTVRQNGYRYMATLFTDVTERMRAETALRESEERYRSLVEVSPDAVILMDLEGTIRLCNRRAAALHGCENGEELLSKNFFDLVAGDDRDRAMANAMRIVQQGGIRDVEYHMLRQDGAQFSAELSASIIRDLDGKAQAITAVFRDITERKRTDEALQRSEEHFRSLTENLSDVILILDAEGTIRYQSPSVARVLGHRPEERVGKKVFDYAHPDDLAQLKETFRRAMQRPGSLQTTELRVKHADGSWRDLECVGRIRSGDAGETVAIVTARDVTGRKLAERALRESEERYRGLVQASPDAVAFTDLNGRILLCNHQAAAVHGFRTIEDLMGKNAHDLVAPEDRGSAMAAFARTVERGIVSHFEYELLRRDGSHFPAEMSASRVVDQDGTPIGLTAVWRDISERRRAQEELERTNAFIDLLRSVAVAANEATTLTDALTSTLTHVCERVGWPAGHAYVAAEDAQGTLVSAGAWYPQAARRAKALRSATRQTRIASGDDLPGQVLATGKPAWTPDLRDYSFARGEAAREAGLLTSFAFPVRVGDEVAAVLEFFSEEFEEPDESLLEVMASIGTTLGRVVERRRARDEIDRVFTLSQDMLAIVGFDGDFRRANPTFCRALGFDETELMAVPFVDLVHPHDLNAFATELRRLASGNPVNGFEMRMRCRDGSYRWTQWNGTPFPAERVIYAHGRDITDRKRSEEALLKATDEVRDLYNAAPCGYHSLDENGVFVRINDTELEWLGYKRNEVIGKKKMTHFLTPAGRKAFLRGLRGFRQRGWMSAVEVEMVRKNGNTFPALISASAVKDANGKFIMTRSTVFDITERKRAEEELRESESRARAIVNTAQDAFVAIDQSGIITDWNPQAETTFGWSRREAVGRKLAETIIPPRYRRLHRSGMARFLQTGAGPVLNRRIELVAIDRQGREFPVEMTVSPVEIGDEFAFNSFIHDITERKQAEAMRARLAAIVESSDDAIIGTNLNGEITSWNKAATRLFRYSMREAIGKPITMLEPSELQDDSPPALNGKSGGGVKHFETIRLRKNGSRVDVSVTVSPILDAEGTVIGASTIARDVTARRRAEELARRAEDLARSNADLEQFAYVASHDLQEPLRMVTGYCDLLQRRYKGKLDGDADDFITFAAEGAQRMQELVRGLLEYSRVGPHARIDAPLDSNVALKRAVANLQVAIEESGAVVTHGRLPTVLADRTQFEHVFQNLIGNAIKFRGDETPHIDIRAVRDNGMWRFSVRDNGIGIDSQYAEKVFAIFQRLHGRGKYPGTGLGLAICKKIIERHGGRIWFESEPGKGTTFYFTLPTRGRTEP
jgi:PAS domain S-box-containing protein